VGVWAASSRARVRPVGPAPIMRMSISGLDMFVMRFVRIWGEERNVVRQREVG
jgi:hypothetical protein